jgi:hypothetical protein
VKNTYKDFQGFVTTVLKLLKSSFKVVLTLKAQFKKKINDIFLNFNKYTPQHNSIIFLKNLMVS